MLTGTYTCESDDKYFVVIFFPLIPIPLSPLPPSTTVYPRHYTITMLVPPRCQHHIYISSLHRTPEHTHSHYVSYYRNNNTY